MNQTAKDRLEYIRTPEPEIRLRKGPQLDGTWGGDNDNHNGDLEPVIEASVLSTRHKKVSCYVKMVRQIYWSMAGERMGFEKEP